MSQRTVTTRGVGNWIGIGLSNLPLILLLAVAYATRPDDDGDTSLVITIFFTFFFPLNILWGLLVARLAVEVSNAFERRAVGVLAGTLMVTACGFALGGLIYELTRNPKDVDGIYFLAIVWVYLLLSSTLIGGISALLNGQHMVVWVCARCERRVWPAEAICPNCSQPLQPSVM
jgi:hypothetical protein